MRLLRPSSSPVSHAPINLPRNRVRTFPGLAQGPATARSPGLASACATFSGWLPLAPVHLPNGSSHFTNLRPPRQLLALKITCYVLVGAFLSCIGLAIWQLTIPSMLAAVYAALAGVFATSIGICFTIYHHRRKVDRDDRGD